MKLYQKSAEINKKRQSIFIFEYDGITESQEMYTHLNIKCNRAYNIVYYIIQYVVLTSHGFPLSFIFSVCQVYISK